MTDYSTYQNPLITRYASKEMQYAFSDEKRFKLWRKLWVALAEAESELGLPITREQVDDLKKYQSDINYDVAEAYEREVRHDVMAHVKAYGEQAKIAAPIIHLGATSCYGAAVYGGKARLPLAAGFVPRCGKSRTSDFHGAVARR